MPKQRRSTSTQARGRKERILRYILRKRPCCYITIGEIISLIVLTSLFVLSLILYLEDRRTIEQFDREDVLLKRMGNHITFAHCNFIEPGKFEKKYCENRIGNQSYAWRHYKLDKNEKDPTCIDLHEQVSCHESVSTNILKLETRVHKECAGLNEQSMPYAESFSFNITAPVFNNTELEEYKGLTVLAQELFLQCPHCKVRSRQFKVDGQDKCMVKLNTTIKGFPSFAEDCDDVVTIIHASQQCKDS